MIYRCLWEYRYSTCIMGWNLASKAQRAPDSVSTAEAVAATPCPWKPRKACLCIWVVGRLIGKQKTRRWQRGQIWSYAPPWVPFSISIARCLIPPIPTTMCPAGISRCFLRSYWTCWVARSTAPSACQADLWSPVRGWKLLGINWTRGVSLCNLK